MAEVQQMLAVLDLASSQFGHLLLVADTIHARLDLQQVLGLVLRLHRLCNCAHPRVLVGTDVLQVGHSPPLLVIVVAVAHLNFIRTNHNCVGQSVS